MMELNANTLESIFGGRQRTAAEKLTIAERASGPGSACALALGIAGGALGPWGAAAGALGGFALCGGGTAYLTDQALKEQAAADAAAQKK